MIFMKPIISQCIELPSDGGFWIRTSRSQSLRRKKIFLGKVQFVEHIGGPGVLKIERDNVVVIETLRAYKDVLVAGAHNLTCFNFVKTYFPLRSRMTKNRRHKGVDR